MKRLFLIAASALLLSACASGGGMHEGMVYRDGSWYSPAADGRGDYYTASPRYDDAYDYPFDFSIGLVPYGGYCPVRYRYCTSFWADPFYGGFYDPFYDPYWYQPWIYYQPAPRPHRPPPRRPIAGLTPDEGLVPPPGEPSERPRPRVWDERPAHVPRASEDGGGVRPRRRGTLSGGGSR